MEGCLEATRLVKIRCKMKYTIICLFILFFIPLISAESTFFDQDDAFIMGDSPATTGGAVSGGGGCSYKWNCTDWSECLPSGKQTRICMNIGTCSNTYKIPEIEQSCTYTAPEIKEDKELEKENITEKEGGTDELLTNWNYLLFITIVALFCVGCIGIFKFRKKIKSLMNGLGREYDNNSVRGLINKEVYTDEGYRIGNVEEVILHHNKIHSLRIILDKRYKFVTKGVIVNYRDVKSIGRIVIVDDTILDHLRKFKN